MERGDEEKKTLSLHRYKNWVATINGKDQEIVALQQQIAACREQLIYAYLEAREEQEKLIAAGLTRQQIEAVGIIPAVPFDALYLVRTVKEAES